MGTRLCGTVVVHGSVFDGGGVSSCQLYASSSRDDLVAVVCADGSEEFSPQAIDLSLSRGYAVTVFLKQIVGSPSSTLVDVYPLRPSKLSPPDFFDKSLDALRSYFSRFSQQERIDRLYALGLSLDDALGDVDLLRRDLVASSQRRLPVDVLEERLRLIGKAVGCSRVVNNLIGLASLSKLPVRDLLFPKHSSCDDARLEEYFSLEGSNLSYRRDPQFVELRGKLLKKYSSCARALCRGQYKVFSQLCADAQELEERLSLFVSLRASGESLMVKEKRGSSKER